MSLRRLSHHPSHGLAGLDDGLDYPMSDALLAANNLTCPTGGIVACDNGGECGLCLMEYRGDYTYCPYGGGLARCDPASVGFGYFCEATGGHSFQELACGPKLTVQQPRE